MRKARSSPDATVESIRESVVALRRLFQRKELTELWAAAFGEETKLNYTELRLLDAVREAGQGATVGAVSIQLGIDPSRASRQVASAVARGLLLRRAEQRDGRKVVLEITRTGATIQERGSELTRARIALALTDWTGEERARFATLFGAFTKGLRSTARRPHPGRQGAAGPGGP